MAKQDLHAVASRRSMSLRSPRSGIAPDDARNSTGPGKSLFMAAIATSSSSSSSPARSRSSTIPATTPKIVVVHHPGEFTGECRNSRALPRSSRPSPGRDCDVYEISPTPSAAF